MASALWLATPGKSFRESFPPPASTANSKTATPSRRTSPKISSAPCHVVVRKDAHAASRRSQSPALPRRKRNRARTSRRDVAGEIYSRRDADCAASSTSAFRPRWKRSANPSRAPPARVQRDRDPDSWHGTIRDVSYPVFRFPLPGGEGQGEGAGSRRNFHGIKFFVGTPSPQPSPQGEGAGSAPPTFEGQLKR